MNVASLRPGMIVNGVRVTRVTRPVSAGRQLTRVYFADGTSELYGVGGVVAGRVQSGNPAGFAAGPVREGWFVASPPKVRVASGRWRGESGRKRDDIIAHAAAFAGYAG